jgi:myo-inositol-1(or 4)-monophosphatase
VVLGSDQDWLAFCRRAAHAARGVVAGFETSAERGLETGRGEGGDTALVIDRAAEDAVFAELEGLEVGLVAVSEERGEVSVHGGGPVRVVIDPVDGSLNAKRRLPSACVSIAVASGPRMADVKVGYVAELDRERDWWAVRGEGAFCGDIRLDRLQPGPLEILGLETARPSRVAAQAEAIAASGAQRLRILGAVATSLCLVAAGRIDAMVTMGEVRSVDVAAGQLLVSETGGALALPGGDALDLRMRSRVFAARDPELLERLQRSFS